MGLPRSWSGVLLLTLMVTGVVAAASLAFTVMHGGLANGLIHRWGRMFGVGMLVGWPTAALIASPVRRFVAWLTG